MKSLLFSAAIFLLTACATQSQPTHQFTVKKTAAEWKKQLGLEAYEVTRLEGTERAYSSKYWNLHDKGIFSCVCCGLDLFSSDTKFDSGTGWPSFYQALNKTCVLEESDKSYGMVRTKVTCSRCGAHLGHVFDDGPNPTGLRYCMNGIALTFRKK